MKNKISIIFGIVGIILFLSACSSTSDYQLDFHSGGSAIASTSHTPFETLGELVEASDHIVYGQLIDATPFGDFIEYHFQVNQQLKGKTHRSQISVFASEGFRPEQKQQKHLLFLTSLDMELYEEIIYKTVIQPIVIEKDKAITIPFENKQLKQLIRDIERSPKIEVFKEKSRKSSVVQEPKNIEDLIEKSDYIVHIKPLEIYTENPILKYVSYELFKKYKGDDRILQQEKYMLPPNIELGEEYLVFFHYINPHVYMENPSITLTTRKGSVIDKRDTTQWDEAIKAIEASLE